MDDESAERLRGMLLRGVPGLKLDEARKAELADRLRSMSPDDLRRMASETPARPRWGFDDLAAEYARRGLAVGEVAGKCWFGRTMVSCPHDDVPYCVDAHPTQREPDWDHGIRHRALLIERHHAMIKAVYGHCAKAGVGEVWVMAGGGAQLQAFFGNSEGYLGILCLTLEDLGEQESLSRSGHLRAVGGETHTLEVKWDRNNAVFAGMDVPGVRVRRSRPLAAGWEEPSAAGQGGAPRAPSSP